MNIFKKLFGRKKVGLAETINSSAIGAYILIGCDINDNHFIKCDVKPDHEENMATLLFYINSGLLAEKMLMAVKQFVPDEEKANFIIQETYNALVQFMEEEDEEEDNSAVVDPCNVFSEENEEDDID